MSEELAKAHGLYVTAGSDAHGDASIAGTGLESDSEIKTIEDFINLVKSGKAKIIRK